MIDDAAELQQLRDAVNNTRALAKGIHTQARAFTQLAADLDDRLERFDTRLQQRQRQAQEAKQNGNAHTQHRDTVAVR